MKINKYAENNSTGLKKKDFVAQITPKIEKFIADNSSRFISEDEWFQLILTAFPEETKIDSKTPYLNAVDVFRIIRKTEKNGIIFLNDYSPMAAKFSEYVKREKQIYEVEKGSIKSLTEQRNILEKQLHEQESLSAELRAKNNDLRSQLIVAQDTPWNKIKDFFKLLFRHNPDSRGPM